MNIPVYFEDNIKIYSTKGDVCMDIQYFCLGYKYSLMAALETSEKKDL
jgi:hypothetical protein